MTRGHGALSRIEEVLLSSLRLAHEANLAVLTAIGDTLPAPPLVDLLPGVPRLVDRGFAFTSRLVELQRRYTLRYLAVLGAPDPPRGAAE
jgi:hypothetical protein